MARTQFGLPLDKPSPQNLLPVVSMPSARVYGYFPIAETTFQGNETTFAVDPSNQSMPLKSVTLPQHGLLSNGGRVVLDDGVQSIPSVTQYMAIVFTDDQLVAADRGMYGTSGINTSAPWLGCPSFIDPKQTGYASQYINALVGPQLRLSLGALVGPLNFGMNFGGSTVLDTPAPQVGNANATLNWFANISQAQLVGQCPFFDFSWVTLFQSSAEKAIINGSPLGMGIENLSQLTVATVPQHFKAYLVNRPTITTGTNLQFDTVRIMLTDDSVTAGAYEFDFVIQSDKGTVAVKLTLTVTVG